MCRIRILRRLFMKMRDAKIEEHIYHSLYMLSKGNQFKNKRVLTETIHRMKSDRAEEKALAEQADARKSRAAKRVAKRELREAKLTSGSEQ
mmetsp:Transcript_15541/g.30992  ORF Transcript_15541/g.30992 Transcript_15541/m.30992 type:complete len:91 (+) Transcript_15541:274-546(+)